MHNKLELVKVGMIYGGNKVIQAVSKILNQYQLKMYKKILILF